MKRLLLNTLAVLVIAGGSTQLAAAETGETPWQTCFNACIATHPGAAGYHFCREDCAIFEPSRQAEPSVE